MVFAEILCRSRDTTSCIGIGIGYIHEMCVNKSFKVDPILLFTYVCLNPIPATVIILVGCLVRKQLGIANRTLVYNNCKCRCNK